MSIIYRLLFFLCPLLFISCSKEIILPKYNLIVSINPTTAGSVNISSGTFIEGENISILAKPSNDFLFLDWSGSIFSSENPLNLQIVKNENIIANFVPKNDSDKDGIPDNRDSEPNTRPGVPVDANGKMKNPIYLAENGITIKAFEWSIVGDKGFINGKEFRIIDEKELRELISKDADVTNIVTSFIENGDNLFYEKKNFNQNISSWDVSNFTSMDFMFAVDIEGIDYFDGTYKNTFSYSKFNQDISKWETSKVKSMYGTFLGASFNGNIANWDVSNVREFGAMFAFSKFNNDISNWNLKNALNTDVMFYSSDFNQNISNWDVSNVTYMAGMFAFSEFNQNISKWNVSRVDDMSLMFEKSKFNQDISNWDVGNVLDMTGMFAWSNFNRDLSKWNVGKVTNMTAMFALSEFNGDISKWDVSNVKVMATMFNGSKFNRNISKWNVSNVEIMYQMIAHNDYFNQDLSNWNVLNVKDCRQFSIYSSNWTLPKPNFTNCIP